MGDSIRDLSAASGSIEPAALIAIVDECRTYKNRNCCSYSGNSCRQNILGSFSTITGSFPKRTLI